MSAPSATEHATAKPVANDVKKPNQRKDPEASDFQKDSTGTYKRRKPRVQASYAYYVCSVDAAGEVNGMILKLQTIGQARKAKENAAKCAKVPLSMVRVVRVVVVE